LTHPEANNNGRVIGFRENLLHRVVSLHGGCADVWLQVVVDVCENCVRSMLLCLSWIVYAGCDIERMAWAANFDDFLNLPVINTTNLNMQATVMHNAFGNAGPANMITETTTIAELYSGMPVVVCLAN